MQSFTLRILRDGLLVLVGLILVLSFLNVRIPRTTAPKGDAQSALRMLTLRVDGKPLRVEIAETESEQQNGLSFRTSLGQNEGMLFLFPDARPRSFWMYGMQFPLDMIFIRDGVVVEYEENVPPPAQTANDPAVVTTLESADMVLEINAGRAKELNIGIGSRVELES